MYATQLKRLRTTAALSQRDLARLAGVSQATVVSAERGGESTIRKLAVALGVKPVALMVPINTPTLETAS